MNAVGIKTLAMIAAAILMCTTGSAVTAQDGGALVPREVAPDPLVVKALSADWLTPEELATLKVRHGTWEERDLVDSELRAQASLIAMRVGNEIFSDESVSPHIRAEAFLHKGMHREALAVLELEDNVSSHALRSLAWELAGNTESAENSAKSCIDAFKGKPNPTAEDVLSVVNAMQVLGRTQGMPSENYQKMLDLLADARDSMNRLDPRPRIAEAQILLDRGKIGDAVPALHESLRRNPRSAIAWYLLGKAAIARFDFEGAEVAAATMERLGPFGNSTHPLSSLIRAESSIVQDDPDTASDILDELLKDEPHMVQAIALRAAVDAVRHDESGTQAWLERMDEVSPGSPVGWYEVGRRLAFDRQYETASRMLKEAIQRRPAWPNPHIELGLLEMQSGRDDEAMAALRTAQELDPFNARVVFSLFLLEELEGFETIESEHFVLRYKSGEDEVVAKMMLDPLEKMHADVAGRFGHEPDRKTVIELMPDHAFFSVRITGMPRIHTIAACTGPLIAIEVPREGPPDKHLGLFDWLRVLRHEYTHTITLSQTRNRIPHWLTEAAAVSMEDLPRKYQTARDLAERWRRGDLFDLDEINWAFVRPEQPGDRSFAYAQGHWMVEYMNERFGENALIRLLDRYFEGIREVDAIPEALGVGRDEFYEGFISWAGSQVASWGLDPSPTLDDLADRIREQDDDQLLLLEQARQRRLESIAGMLAGEIGQASRRSVSRAKAENWPSLQRPPVQIDDASLVAMLKEFPNHPDLLELVLRRSSNLEGSLTLESRSLLERYAEARPVDPFPHRVLARELLVSDQPADAIPHLVELDLRSEKENAFALELANLLRSEGRSQAALSAAERAVRMDPYRPSNRELAAAAAIEAGNLQSAMRHIEALLVLEPDQPLHVRRIDAIKRLLIKDQQDG